MNNSGKEITIIPADNGWVIYPGDMRRSGELKKTYVAETMQKLLCVVKELAEAPAEDNYA